MTLKSAARDPVADTIQRDLIAKKGYDMVSHVRSGQYLKISLQAEDKDSAKDIIVQMCNDLRIYNPVTQKLNILNVTEANQ
ncbi:MAG: phosphoribosylformylglycinamidine synthase subunit PurS [Candidatus Lokiarchaeota archaeon]|nr:phosphoribosylformylglycinamidine synthase subunit PurS [Candidatus Lokiarchaeota archaeon]